MEKTQFENYFKNYYALVFRIAFSELKSHADAGDIVQDVFLKLLLYQPAFESTEHEKAWLIRITINQCKDYQKNKWNNSTIGFEHIPESEKAYFKVPHVESDDTLWAVLELKENYRRPLYLFYYEDYSIKEIAALLHIPENTDQNQSETWKRTGKKIIRSI